MDPKDLWAAMLSHWNAKVARDRRTVEKPFQAIFICRCFTSTAPSAEIQQNQANKNGWPPANAILASVAERLLQLVVSGEHALNQAMGGSSCHLCIIDAYSSYSSKFAIKCPFYRTLNSDIQKLKSCSSNSRALIWPRIAHPCPIRPDIRSDLFKR